MRAGRNAIAASVFRPTVALGSTGGKTTTYPGTATASLRGQFIRADVDTRQTPNGRDFEHGYWLVLPDGTDVRPMERSDHEEEAPDRIQIGGRNYLCLWAETYHGLGNPVRAWLVRERD